MLRYYKPAFFKLEEFVSMAVFKNYGERAWEFLNPNMLYTLDCMREFFGVPLTINNWHKGGKREYCGFREPECKVGSDISQHKLGGACDIISKIEAKTMRYKIIEKNILFPYITTIEDDVDWLHFDGRARDIKSIVLIKP